MPEYMWKSENKAEHIVRVHATADKGEAKFDYLL